jgi:hypothetical protein
VNGYNADHTFSEKQIRVMKRAADIVAWINDQSLGAGRHDMMRCHEVARIVGLLLDLPVVDGKYGAVDHSWLILNAYRSKACILDVYSVGSLPMVQLRDASIPGADKLYRHGDLRTDIHQKIVDMEIDLWRRANPPGGSEWT